MSWKKVKGIGKVWRDKEKKRNMEHDTYRPWAAKLWSKGLSY
jgi:hypothetical protein